MGRSRRHEMRNFFISVSALVAIVIAAVIIYSILDGAATIKREAEDEKQRVIGQLANYVIESFNATQKLGTDPEVMKTLDVKLIEEATKGNFQPLMNFTAQFLRNLYHFEYVAFVVDGKVVALNTREGLDISSFAIPISMPDSRYEVITELGDEDGYYVSMFAETVTPGLGRNQFANFVLDRTEQIKGLNDFYSSERSGLIKREIIGGIIGVLGTFILILIAVSYLTRRFITKPIEEISRISQQITEGTFEGEIVVDVDSDYAALQSLLQSGKKILDKMLEAD